MRKAIVVVATILLFATAVSGCLGGKLVTRQASEFILTSSDIPGNWSTIFSVDYAEPTGDISNGASRMYQNNFLNGTRVAIVVLVFVSVESARIALENQSWRINFSLPPGAKYSSPEIGDESHMITLDLTGGFEDKTIFFRKANVVATGGVMYLKGSLLTDPWFINLMKKQAAEIN